MSRFKRILSFLMAIVIMMSTLSIVAQGRASYLDGYLTNYDDVDQPVITFDQACTMVLDAVDVMLAPMETIDLSILGSLRLNSLNNALDDVYKLLGNILLGLAGDLNDLDRAPIKDARRNNGGQNTNDTAVLYSLVDFLGNSSNRTVIGKLIDGTINLGVAKSFVDLSKLNINQMVKEALYKAAYPDTAVPKPVNNNADAMVQKLITDLVQGKLDPVTGEYDGIAPELVPYIDIVNTTAPAYDFIGTLLQQAWNLMLVPLINTDLKKTVREACGVVYDPLLEEDPLYTGDASKLNEYANILNINFVVPAFTVPAGSTFIAELNNILASVVNALTLNYTWAAGSNTNLKANFVAAAKYILGVAGDGLFPDYLDVKPIAEVNAMTDQELISYLLRSVLNGAVDTIYIPADADTLVEVAWYGVKEALASKLPAINYAAQPKTQAGLLYMLADLLACTINEKMDMNPVAGTVPGAGLIQYGQGLDATLLAVTNWARTNYGGLFSATFSTTNAWSAIDTLLFGIVLQANWLPASVNGSSYELLINRIVGGALNLDVTSILSLFERRGDSELATKTIKKILIDTVARVINSIFPATVGNFTSFDTLLTNANLAVIIKNICAQLNSRKTSILPAILPLLTKSMKRSTPQAYEDPDIQLPDVVGAAITFDISNASTGINTGATDKNGNFVKDNLYKIKIVSVTSSIPAITVSNLAGTVINGGDVVACSLGGTFTADQQLMITVTYNVLTEDGTVLTPVPLSQRAFSYISTVVDDGTVWTTVDDGDNNYHKMKYLNSYFNYPAAPEAPEAPAAGATEVEISIYNAAYAQWQLDMIQYPIDRNASMQEFKNPFAQMLRDGKTTLGAHAKDATVSRVTATVNATLAANGVSTAPFANFGTNGDGGGWNLPYFAVSTSPTRPADGLYESNYKYKATKTQTFGSDKEYTIPYKLVLYTDYGLPSLLEGAVNANRDPNDYSSATLYNNYIAAVKSAVAVCYRPRVAASFMTTHAPLFEAAATNLKAAIKALEATAVSVGVEPLKTAIDVVVPLNNYDDPANPGMKLWYEYDDPNYNYFGKEDYVAYTYGRYQAEKDNAKGLWDSQQLPEEPVLRTTPPPTPEEQAAFTIAHDKWELDYAAAVLAISPVKAVDVAYALNRFNVYADRLVRVPAVKDRLNDTIALVQGKMPVAYGCSAAAWEKFDRAYQFALAVNADTDVNLRQTKVIQARDTLIEAWKKTTQVFVQVPTETGFVIDNVNFYISGLAIDEIIETFVSATGGGTVIFHETPDGQGTGTVVDLMSGDDLIRSYTIIIYGDVSGDASTTALDSLMALRTATDLATLDPNQTLAADVNSDDELSAIDALMILQYSVGLITEF